MQEIDVKKSNLLQVIACESSIRRLGNSVKVNNCELSTFVTDCASIDLVHVTDSKCTKVLEITDYEINILSTRSWF